MREMYILHTIFKEQWRILLDNCSNSFSPFFQIAQQMSSLSCGLSPKTFISIPPGLEKIKVC